MFYFCLKKFGNMQTQNRKSMNMGRVFQLVNLTTSPPIKTSQIKMTPLFKLHNIIIAEEINP